MNTHTRPSLQLSLTEAWIAKAMAARINLMHAVEAPALFKPSYVEELRADIARATFLARYFQTS